MARLTRAEGHHDRLPSVRSVVGWLGPCRGAVVLWMVVAAVTAACAPAGKGPTVAAAGKLTAGGKPLASVNVTFTPARGRSASATTDAGGLFTLSTFTAGDGAVPGTHRVTLSLSTADVPMPGTPEAASYVPPKAAFAAKYAGLSTTDLTVDIPAGGNRSIVLDVSAADDARPSK